MNKNELLGAISTVLKENEEFPSKAATKKSVEVILDAVAKVIQDTLVAGDELTLPGVAKFSTKVMPGRSGVSTLGGVETEWKTDDKTVPVIKAVKALKEAVL